MSKNQKLYKCFRKCGADIYFDDALKSDSGKAIPIDKATDKPHDCPNKDNPNTTKTSTTSGTLPPTVQQPQLQPEQNLQQKDLLLDSEDRILVDCQQLLEIEHKVTNFLFKALGTKPADAHVGYWVKLIWQRRNR